MYNTRGTTALWKRQKTLEDDLLVVMKGQIVPVGRVSVGEEGVGGGDAVVVEVDVLGAWDELGLDAGWNNEVGVRGLFATNSRIYTTKYHQGISSQILGQT